MKSPGEPNNGAERRGESRRWALYKFRIRYFFRSFFLAFSVMLPIAITVLLMTTTASPRWSTTSNGYRPQNWLELNPVAGACSCVDTAIVSCNEEKDTFNNTRWLSVASLACQGTIALLLLWELGSYGVYGGTKTFSRLILILNLITLASLVLSLVAYRSALYDQTCGNLSYSEQGYKFHWAFGVRIVEVAFTGIYTVYSAWAFRQASRGPPSVALFTLLVTMGITAVTTQANGWMTNDSIYTTVGLWSRCVCHDPTCNTVKNAMNSSLGLGIIAIFLSYLTSFFAVLRAVDSKGRTLIASLVCSLFCGAFQFANWALFGATLNTYQCGVKNNQIYNWNWAFAIAIFATVMQVFFFVMNAVYLCPPCSTCCGRNEPANEGKNIFQVLWWDQLKDPRELAHEEELKEEAPQEPTQP